MSHELSPEQARVLALWPRGVVVSRRELALHAITLKTVLSLIDRGWVEPYQRGWRRLHEDPAPPAALLSPAMVDCVKRMKCTPGGRLTEADRLQVHLTTLRALQRRSIVTRTACGGWRLTRG